ncbi:hypothetical protein M8818_002644 [Zalaria obscura]|uniref:Uncharacterized protein n=1 Tax=Zalaria obscura TaxID=2024903 RepID=A0ACC3SGH7_9PEZI
MSEASGNEGKPEEKSIFSPREEAVLKAAWLCLKSGVPEIDMEKLKEKAGFNTIKTTQNTWGKIKQKLFTDEEGNSMPVPSKPAASESPTKTKPKKGPATPKKRGKSGDDDEEHEDEGNTSPKKKGRKSPVKKGVKAEQEDIA